MFIQFIKSIKYTLLLIIIAVLTHIEWFNPYSTLTFSDWYYWPDMPVSELYYSWGTWINQWHGLGEPNIQIYFNAIYAIWSLLSHLGIPYNLSSKVNLFIPISILGFLAPYFLIRNRINDNFIAFVCAIFYGSTSYFLVSQNAHLPIAFVYSLTPLVLLFYIKALKHNDLINWIYFSLIFSLSVLYELRISYIVSFILVIYFLVNHLHEIKKYIKNHLLVLVIVILVNSFWILPTIFGGLFQAVGAITSRGLFGDFLTNIMHAMSLSHWSWTGGYPDQNFYIQPIKIYFWIIPIIIFSSLIFIKDFRKVVFFLTLSLLGIFLVKQSSYPFTSLYLWLYEYFPGFSLFRESSKFYLLVSVGYMGLLAFALSEFRKQKIIFIVSSTLVLFVSFFNLLPLLNKSMEGLFVNKQMPQEYVSFSRWLSSSDEYFRVLYVPNYSRWVYFSNTHPRLGLVNLLNKEWKDKLTIKDISNFSDGELMMSIINSSRSNDLLDRSSIKYVIVPILDKESDDDFFKYYGESRDYYIRELDRIDYLKRIDIGTNVIAAYENEDYLPYIWISKDFNDGSQRLLQEVSLISNTPTRKEIEIKNINENFIINFSENYHPGWKIRVGEFSWIKSLLEKDHFLLDENHLKNGANLNSFRINISEICSKYKCIQNPDGTYNIKFSLFFMPQAYFYLGLIVGVVTLIIIGISIVIVLLKKKNV